jgi:hypothetical protein
LIALPLAGQVAETNDLKLHFFVTELTSPQAPKLVRDHIVFSYRDGEVARYVGIAFSLDGFRNVYPFSKNRYGVFFYTFPEPKETNTFEYRFIIDGIWSNDPENKVFRVDEHGLKLSQVIMPNRKADIDLSPVIRNNMVEFTLKDSVDKRVYLLGSFNNFNPYMYQMDEILPGIYSTRIRLNEGQYKYYYLVGGSRKHDPLNPYSSYNSEGFRLSVLVIPSG